MYVAYWGGSTDDDTTASYTATSRLFFEVTLFLYITYILYIHTYKHNTYIVYTYAHTYMLTYNIYKHTYIHAFINTYIYTYIYTYTHTYIHTHLNSHTYIHIYIHIYIHTPYHRFAFACILSAFLCPLVPWHGCSQVKYFPTALVLRSFLIFK